MSAHLTAVYTSPTATNTFSSPLSTTPAKATSPTDKAQYLGDLRDKVAQMQSDINNFLTEKMQEDTAATHGAASPKDEDMDEQMYGEEVVDDD